ncbi:hypothetical protein B188_27570 [Candidatus Brocadiaceae bacterium B188]|jgi:hypothetical protein|nr:hypothetical protein B188_27570 [Candidatus Brocadiaceae bacterium B188]
MNRKRGSFTTHGLRLIYRNISIVIEVFLNIFFVAMVLPGVSGTVEVKGTIIHLLSEDSCNLEVGNYGSTVEKRDEF